MVSLLLLVVAVCGIVCVHSQATCTTGDTNQDNGQFSSFNTFAVNMNSNDCAGTVIAWHYCFHTDNVDSSSGDTYEFDAAIYMVLGNGNLRLVSGSQRNIRLTGSSIMDIAAGRSFACDTLTLSEAEQFEVREEDVNVVGACVRERGNSRKALRIMSESVTGTDLTTASESVCDSTSVDSDQLGNQLSEAALHLYAEIMPLATVPSVSDVPAEPSASTSRGVTLELNGVAVPNFGLLGHSEIDTSVDPASVGSNLVCWTNNTSCCRSSDNPNGAGFGNWFYPDGGVVVLSFENLPNQLIYRQLRGAQAIRLYREGSANTTTANGIYHCEVADQNGVTQTRYVGLYSEGAGAVTVGASLQFALIDPGSFRLFAITSGGPPTTFSWRGPNGVLSNADSIVTVQNGSTSTVQLELRVTGNVPGEYTFTATNSRTTGDVTSTLTVTASMPTGLMAVQEGAGIRVTWSAPASGPTPTSYVVYYQAGSSGIQTAQTGSTDILLTDNLVNGAEHRIEVAALANIPGERAGPVTVDFLLAPDPPVVTLTDAMATGVTVGWNSQGGVDSYEVLYNRTTGSAQQGACPDFVDMGSATADGGDTSLTLQNIEEFSNYTITVIAMNRIASVSSTAVEFMTPSAAPSPPTVALVTSTNTTIAVSWTALSCIHQNSQFTIVSYAVRYGRESGSERTQVLVTGTSTAFAVSNLEPGTRYSIAVAAVNSNGETGEFSEPIVGSTSGAFSISSSVPAPVVLGVGLLLSLLLNAATITALVVKCRQGHTTDQQEMTDLSDAKISTAPCEAYNTVASGHSGRAREEPHTAPCEAYNTVASGHSGRAREEPQYETVPPATGLGDQDQGEPEYEQV